MSVNENLNSLSNDVKTMMKLLDEHNISYKGEIGYPLDDVEIVSDYINQIELENQRIECLEEQVDDLTREISWKDDDIESLENEVYELENEVDSLKRELENIER